MLQDSARQTLETNLSKVLRQFDERPDTSSVQFAIKSPSRSWSWEWYSPDASQQYFIASITKLYVTALILQLRAEGLLDLDDPAHTHLPSSVVTGINTLKGRDYSGLITIRELLSHTSGIADYLEQRQKDGSTQFGKALKSDFAWTFEDVLTITKNELKPKFPPSTRKKAFYSDTNYQLLGHLIESVTQLSFEEALRQRILQPLGLDDTFPFVSADIDRYGSVASMLYGKDPVNLPLMMASVRADGGIVSTATDGISFLQAFMNGRLFPKTYLPELQTEWRAIFHPLKYGTGIMLFDLPRYYTLINKAPRMIGHSGASGTVLFYVPKLDLYISGTVNQIKKRSLVYKLLTRIVLTCQNSF